MLTIPEVYDLFGQIGCCSFTTSMGAAALIPASRTSLPATRRASTCAPWT